MDMLLHGTRKYNFLEVSAFVSEVGDCVFVRNARDILLDDRPGVKLCSDIVAGGAYQLYASLIRLVIWLCAHESRQKRVVDIDDAIGVSFDEIGR